MKYKSYTSLNIEEINNHEFTATILDVELLELDSKTFNQLGLLIGNESVDLEVRGTYQVRNALNPDTSEATECSLQMQSRDGNWVTINNEALETQILTQINDSELYDAWYEGAVSLNNEYKITSYFDRMLNEGDY